MLVFFNVKLSMITILEEKNLMIIKKKGTLKFEVPVFTGFSTKSVPN